jgi:hypothetical protein
MDPLDGMDDPNARMDRDGMDDPLDSIFSTESVRPLRSSLLLRIKKPVWNAEIHLHEKLRLTGAENLAYCVLGAGVILIAVAASVPLFIARSLEKAAEKCEYPVAGGGYLKLESYHLSNVTASCVSLACFTIWIFYSPHNQTKHPVLRHDNCGLTKDPDFFSTGALDMKLGTFFATKLLSNLAITVLQCVASCNYVPVFEYGFSLLFYLAIIGTNLLCHRVRLSA